MDFPFVHRSPHVALAPVRRPAIAGGSEAGKQQGREGQGRHIPFPRFYFQLWALRSSKERATPAGSPSALLPAPEIATGSSPQPLKKGWLLSTRKWFSAGTNLFHVFLFFPFLLNGKQSEQFLRMRDINLSAAIYTVLVTAVAKCLKYILAA